MGATPVDPTSLSQRFAGRRSGWSRTAAAAASLVIRAPALSSRGSVIPDSSKRLSEGVVVQTSLLARVLGMKLLTVEGTVLVSPARLQGPDNYVEETPSGGAKSPAERGLAASPNGLVGTRLGLTARLLDENAGDLCDLPTTLCKVTSQGE